MQMHVASFAPPIAGDPGLLVHNFCLWVNVNTGATTFGRYCALLVCVSIQISRFRPCPLVVHVRARTLSSPSSSVDTAHVSIFIWCAGTHKSEMSRPSSAPVPPLHPASVQTECVCVQRFGCARAPSAKAPKPNQNRCGVRFDFPMTLADDRMFASARARDYG